MELTIDLTCVTPRVDYLSRIGGVALTREATAVEAVLANNFKVQQKCRDGDTLRLRVTHGGDPRACANWVAERLGCPVELFENA